MAMARGDSAVSRFEFRLLGPLEVLRDGEPLKVSGERQRALLSLLLVGANELVSTDRIIDELALGDPAGTGVNALQATVSRLRSLRSAAVSLREALFGEPFERLYRRRRQLGTPYS